MHPQLNTTGHTFGDAQQLDTVAQLFSVFDVKGIELGDAFHMGLVKLHRDAEGNGRHDGGFVRGIHAFNVKSRVCFGVTEALRFLEDHVKAQAFVAHFAQDEIGGAVDDAGDPLNTVGGQTLTQGLDDRYATGHCSFKSHHDTFAVGSRKNLGAMHSEQCLVGGDHMLAGLNGLHHQLARNAVAANQFDDDINIGVGNDGASVVHYFDGRSYSSLCACRVQVGDHGDFNAATGAAQDFFLIAGQHIEDTAADNADAQQAHLKRRQITQFHDSIQSEKIQKVRATKAMHEAQTFFSSSRNRNAQAAALTAVKLGVKALRLR